MAKPTTPLLYTIITITSFHGLIMSLLTHTNLKGDDETQVSCSSANTGAFRGCGPSPFWSKPCWIFFCLTLLHLLDVRWQIQEKAGMPCSFFRANCWFLKLYLKLCSGLSCIFYLNKLSCVPELLPKHCSGVEGVGLHTLCIKWAVSYHFIKTKLFSK